VVTEIVTVVRVGDCKILMPERWREMMPIEKLDRTWIVFDGRRWQKFQSNATAWRWIDRQNGDPVSRSEVVSDWLWHKGMGAL
jgi:hypothetical protein